MQEKIIIEIINTREDTCFCDDVLKEKIPYSKVKKRIKRNLIKLRKQNNWDLQKASMNIEIKPSKLRMMEKGYSLSSLYWLQKIARGYNVDIIELFK